MNIRSLSVVVLASSMLSYPTGLFAAKVTFTNKVGRSLNVGGAISCIEGTCSYSIIDSVDNNKTITINSGQYPKVIFISTVTVPTKIESSEIDLAPYADGANVTLNLSGSTIVVK